MKMGEGFTTTSSELEEPKRLIIKESKIFSSFWRDIDVAGAGKRCCGNPEHPLLQNPWG
jgi:hypothetical protein